MQHPFRKIFMGLIGVAGIVVLGWVAMRLIFDEHQVGVAPRSTMGVAIVRNAGGSQLVRSDSGDYRFTVPAEWMVEPIGAEGVAVYPPDPVSSSPRCKLQFSVFENTDRESLEDWMKAHLREDPTVAVRQTSLEAMSFAGSNAMRWTGSMDGRKIVAVYAVRNTKIFEIVPSSLDPDNITPDACMADLDRFLRMISFNA